MWRMTRLTLLTDPCLRRPAQRAPTGRGFRVERAKDGAVLGAREYGHENVAQHIIQRILNPRFFS
jgi:hypothetical protein